MLFCLLVSSIFEKKILPVSMITVRLDEIDLVSLHRFLSDLRGKNAEYEERMMQINKELHGAKEFAKNLKIDLKVKLIILIVKNLFIGELSERSK